MKIKYVYGNFCVYGYPNPKQRLKLKLHVSSKVGTIFFLFFSLFFLLFIKYWFILSFKVSMFNTKKSIFYYLLFKLINKQMF